MVKELLALSRLANRRSMHSYSEDVVRLETINSRRLWDLIGEARALGLPLVQSGRRSLPITFVPSAADVTIDVTRSEAGLRVEPRIGIEGQGIPLQRSMLIGRPAHGIAWWDDPIGMNGAAPPLGLGLAALADPVDDNLRAFLRTAAVDVPSHDEKRFLRTFVPRLRRRVEVASSDGSVGLPEVRRTTLVLTISARDDHGIELTWARSAEGQEWREESLGPVEQRSPTIRRGIDRRSCVRHCSIRSRHVRGYVPWSPTRGGVPAGGNVGRPIRDRPTARARSDRRD